MAAGSSKTTVPIQQTTQCHTGGLQPWEPQIANKKMAVHVKFSKN